MLSNPGKTFSRTDIGKISGISQERSIDDDDHKVKTKNRKESKNQNIYKL